MPGFSGLKVRWGYQSRKWARHAHLHDQVIVPDIGWYIPRTYRTQDCVMPRDLVVHLHKEFTRILAEPIPPKPE